MTSRDGRRRQPMPTSASPMLATLTEERFSDAEWLFERKWDGVRCLAFRTKSGQVRLRTRNDKPLEGTYPEIAGAVANACDVAASWTARWWRSSAGDVRAVPLRERKRLLRNAVHFADPLRFTAHRNTTGEEEFRKACARGDEGVIAKRSDSPYVAGRSRDWLKFKCVHDQELVIGGHTAPKGSRVGFGALLVGYYDGDDFVYAGKVGTGFDTAVLNDLHVRMQAVAQERAPFTRGRVRERDVHWVEPKLVAQIGFTEWTRDGLLRHPRYTGLRTDKDAHDVVREA